MGRNTLVEVNLDDEKHKFLEKIEIEKKVYLYIYFLIARSKTKSKSKLNLCNSRI